MTSVEITRQSLDACGHEAAELPHEYADRWIGYLQEEVNILRERVPRLDLETDRAITGYFIGYVPDARSSMKGAQMIAKLRPHLTECDSLVLRCGWLSTWLAIKGGVDVVSEHLPPEILERYRAMLDKFREYTKAMESEPEVDPKTFVIQADLFFDDLANAHKIPEFDQSDTSYGSQLANLIRDVRER